MRPAWQGSRSPRPPAGPSSTRRSSRATGWRMPTRISRTRSPTPPSRCSTSATRRTPIRPGRSPSRSGCSPTTARSTRSAATASRSAAARPIGPRADRRRAVGRRAAARPDGSDSLSLDEALELLIATAGRSRPRSWRSSARRRACAGRRIRQHRGVRGADGRVPRPVGRPGRLRLRDGRSVGALVDRNGLRPLAYAITRDGSSAAASEAGAVPLSAAETVRRGRLGPGEMLLVDPAAG